MICFCPLLAIGQVVGTYGSGAALLQVSPTIVTPILGTPQSGTLTNCTIPVGQITGSGTGALTFLTTPTSANLAAMLTDENGIGKVIFSAGTLAISSGQTLTVTTGGTLGGAAYISSTAGGDLSGTLPSPTVAKVNGVTYGSSPSTNTVPVVTGSNTITYEAVPNVALANSSMTLGGHAVSLGGTQTFSLSDFTSGAIANGSTVTSQTDRDNSTKPASTAYVDGHYLARFAGTLVSPGTNVTVVNGVGYLPIDSTMNNKTLSSATLRTGVAGTTNSTTIQFTRIRGASTQAMLSTVMTIATGTTSDNTASGTGVIDTASSHNVVQTGDFIRFDVTGASTTPPTGLSFELDIH